MKNISIFVCLLAIFGLSAMASPMKAGSGSTSPKSFKLLRSKPKGKFDFKKIDKLITLGDSYTNANIYDEWTDKSTTVDYLNWVDYVGTKYNKTMWNLACAGATISYDFSTSFIPEVFNLVEQVREVFTKNMTGNGVYNNWKPKNTLFTIWIGINVVDNTRENTELSYEDFEDVNLMIYKKLLDELYKGGARNFLIVNVPPVEKTPFYGSIKNVPDYRKKILHYNELVAEAGKKLYKKHCDVNMMYYDAYTEFNYIEKNAKALGIEDIEHECKVDNVMCEDGPKRFWYDYLHPSTTVHKEFADDLVRFLSKKN